MCGITGFYQRNMDYTEDRRWEAALSRMLESLKRRGPNDNGTFLSTHAGLAHTRLSIIDLVRGHQPITRQYNGRQCTIVYNGELYNFRDLKQNLSAYSLCWETDSDTEVVLNGYLAVGTRFFKELNGIFSFAVYDEALDELLLCRDRLGVKPLFYRQEGSSLIFGSEPKALFAYGIKPRLDKESFGEIFGLGPARTPGKAVFQGMREVLPGHYLRAAGSQITESAYWELEGKPHTDNYEDTTAKVSFLVTDSVKRQMVSDIPICTFLSGGLDSSLVSAICAGELQNSGRRLDTYSFEFAGNQKNFKANSFQSSLDRPFVDIMVSHINSRHTYLECDSRTQAEYLYQAVDAADLPNMADIESSLLYFCSKVADTHRVALTGECADEIFGGYPWFHQEAALTRDAFPWSYDMEARTALLTEEFKDGLGLNEYASDAYRTTVAQTPRCTDDSPPEARRREIAYLNIRWFMSTLLNRMDRTSMYSGLEARVPFADHRILEYVYNIPWDMKCYKGLTKSLLQETGKGLLPDAVLYRKKSPYPKTYDPAYETLLGERLMGILSDVHSPLLGIVDKKAVEDFLRNPSDYGRPWYGQLMAGPQMLAYLLQVDYWMKKFQLC